MFSYAAHEEFVDCQSSYEYDHVGNVIGLKVRMQKTIIPVVDGMGLEWQKQETEKIKNLYKKKVINGKQVEILFDHIFEAEFKFKKCPKTGGHILEIKGGHLPGMCEKLEKFGIAKILKKKTLHCGSTEYTMQNMVTGEIYSKTAFSWCEEKIAKSLYEVYETGVIKYTKKEVPYKTKLIDGVDVSIFCKDSIATTSKGVIHHSKIVSAVPYGDIV